MEYITTTKIIDGKWRGTTEGYIIHWQEQVRKYNELVDIKDHISDALKLNMLQNAVQGLSDLRNVKITADLLKVQLGKTMSYDNYVDVLLSAAQTADSKQSHRPGRSNNTRSVFQHTQEPPIVNSAHDDYYYPNTDIYGIDTPPDLPQPITANFTDQFTPTNSDVSPPYPEDTLVHYTNTPKPRVRLLPSQWAALDTESRQK